MNLIQIGHGAHTFVDFQMKWRKINSINSQVKQIKIIMRFTNGENWSIKMSFMVEKMNCDKSNIIYKLFNFQYNDLLLRKNHLIGSLREINDFPMIKSDDLWMSWDGSWHFSKRHMWLTTAASSQMRASPKVSTIIEKLVLVYS